MVYGSSVVLLPGGGFVSVDTALSGSWHRAGPSVSAGAMLGGLRLGDLGKTEQGVVVGVGGRPACDRGGAGWGTNHASYQLLQCRRMLLALNPTTKG